MKQSFDSFVAVGILRRGIVAGYWTIEDLDKPPQGTKQNLDEWAKHPMASNLRTNNAAYKNLLRIADLELGSDPDVEPEFIL
jgi:hypothetical protein